MRLRGELLSTMICGATRFNNQFYESQMASENLCLKCATKEGGDGKTKGGLNGEIRDYWKAD